MEVEEEEEEDEKAQEQLKQVLHMFLRMKKQLDLDSSVSSLIWISSKTVK